jgi:hypothetical protein
MKSYHSYADMQALAILEESNQISNRLITEMPGLFFLINCSGNIIHANENVTVLISEENANIREIFDLKSASKILIKIQSLDNQLSTDQCSIKVCKLDGNQYILSVSKILNPNMEALYILNAQPMSPP